MNKADNVIDESQVAVTGNFTFTANLPNGKNFSVSGYLYSGESMESINDRVDILHDVVDRQRTRAEIPELEAKRDQIVTAMGQMKDVLASLDVKQNIEGKKLTSQEKLTIENMQRSMVKAQEDVEKGEKAIKDAKLKAGIKL